MNDENNKTITNQISKSLKDAIVDLIILCIFAILIYFLPLLIEVSLKTQFILALILSLAFSCFILKKIKKNTDKDNKKLLKYPIYIDFIWISVGITGSLIQLYYYNIQKIDNNIQKIYSKIVDTTESFQRAGNDFNNLCISGRSDLTISSSALKETSDNIRKEFDAMCEFNMKVYM